MATIFLTFTPSTEEIVSGVPRSVEITSNVPATIYYTLDGTGPTTDSNVYFETLDFSDGVNSVVLSAFAIDSEDNESSILTQTFAPDTTRINVTRIVGAEGKVVDRYSDDTNIVVGYDSEGDSSSYIDTELYKLSPSYSERGWNGIEPGTAIEVKTPNPEDTAYPFDDNFDPHSTTESAQFFNPYAKVIVIDERKNNEVQILNRPFGSMRSISKEFNGNRLSGGNSALNSAYVSGGFVRKFYSQENNVMVSYYFDANTCRYVKNIQELPANIPRTGGFNMSGSPLVFRWIYRGRHSSLGQ